MNSKAAKLILIGSSLILIAPYLPDIFFEVFRFKTQTLYNPMFTSFRYDEVIPSFKLVGIVFTVWGMLLYHRKER